MFGDRRPRSGPRRRLCRPRSLDDGGRGCARGRFPIRGLRHGDRRRNEITLVRPAHAALLPEVAQKPDELAVANAASGTVEGLGALLGPLLAGLLIAVAGPAAVYGANALLALGAAAVVLPLARGALPVLQAPAARTQGLVAELGAGLRTVLGDRRLLAVTAILSGAIALLGAFNVLLTIIAIDLLGRPGKHDRVRGAVAGVGAVVGAGLTSALMAANAWRRSMLRRAHCSRVRWPSSGSTPVRLSSSPASSERAWAGHSCTSRRSRSPSGWRATT